MTKEAVVAKLFFTIAETLVGGFLNISPAIVIVCVFATLVFIDWVLG